MIPKSDITRWRLEAPWNSFEQVEQDLLISRVLVELFKDEFISENLAFRGGTALHKLYLNPAPRYSEDIDLVQIKAAGIGDIMKKIKELITFFGEDRKTQIGGHGAKIWYSCLSEYDNFPIKVKLEINGKEHFNVMGLKKFGFDVKNNWFSGVAEISTYHLSELLGTKLRALYQRKKGRDLFDLFFASTKEELDIDQIIFVFNKYMEFSVGNVPSRKQFENNIKEKQNDLSFSGDMEALLRPDITYHQDEAMEWLHASILSRLR